MKAIQSRLAAVVASFIVAKMLQWGVVEISPETAHSVESWVNHTFDLALFVGYAVIHPWMQKRLNPTGAFTDDAARRLEAVAHVRPGG